MFRHFTRRELVESVIGSVSILAIGYFFAVGFFSMF